LVTETHAKKTSAQKNINLGSGAKGNDERLGKNGRRNTRKDVNGL